MSKILVLGLFLLLVAGGALWFIAYSPQLPSFSFAQGENTAQISSEIQSEVTSIDKQIAAKIREFGENGVDWAAITSPPQVASSLEKVGEATLSATVATTPQEVWRTFREEGSQAVLGSLVENAEVSVNAVSTDIVNEARYQYCVGVVQQYEQLQSPAADEQ